MYSRREKFDHAVGEIWASVSATDVALVFLLPVLLTLVMAQPLSVRQGLMLNVQDPQLWQFLTAAYVHNTGSHYAFNLMVLVLVLAVQVLLIAFTGERRQYYGYYLSTLIVAPLIIGGLEVLVLGRMPVAYTCGVSGVLAALIGATPMVVMRYLSLCQGESYMTAGLPYFCLLYLVVVLAMTYAAPILAGLAIVALFGVLVVYREQYVGVLRAVGWAFRQNYLAAAGLAMVLVLYTYAPFVLFPAVLVHDGAVTDIVSHLAGFVYGTMVGYAFMRRGL